MDLLQKLKLKKQDNILVVGGDEVVAEKTSMPRSQLFFWISYGFLILMMIFTYTSTFSLVDQKEFELRRTFEAQEQKKTEEKNLEALQTLSNRIDTIQDDYQLAIQAIPEDSQYEQVVTFIESSINDIRRRSFIELPEVISWGPVSPNDISNEGIAGYMDVMEFRINIVAEYAALNQFLETLQNSLRIIDVRTIRGLSTTEDGFVNADLVLWTYQLPYL